MKSKKVKLLIKISIPILIIGGCFGIERLISVRAEDSFNKPIIVSENSSSRIADSKPLEIVSKQSYGNIEDGFSANLGFINDDEALIAIGMSREEFYKKYPNEIDKNDIDVNDNAHNDRSGEIYRLKLSNLEKKPLGIEMKNLYSDLVPNVNKINYVKGNNYSIYDLKNDISNDYKKTSNKSSFEGEGTWSKDGNYLMSFYGYGELNLYNVRKNSSKKLTVMEKDDKSWGGINTSFYSEDGQDIYFTGSKYKDNDRYTSNYARQGIFKINSNSGKIEEVLALPYEDIEAQAANFDYSKASFIHEFCLIEGGKKIILNAVIEGEYGTYIYDIASKKFYNVIQHTVKDGQRPYYDPIWVSPDKTKVVYVNRVLEDNKVHLNLYAAKIVGNSLTSKICIYKDIKFSGAINNSVKWSGDSKKILFFTGSEEIEKNNFSFMDKNEVNIITFK